MSVGSRVHALLLRQWHRLSLDRRLPQSSSERGSPSVDPAPIGQLGVYFPRRRQPALSPDQEALTRRFFELNFDRWAKGADTLNLSWFGYEIVKSPLDLWIYQELISRTRPDYVVETGTWAGGSALYFAMLFDHLGHGRVITIDIRPRRGRPRHSRIRYMSGSSVDRDLIAKVIDEVGDGRALVILDSDHHADHVYGELLAYSPLVKKGDYLIVEDTSLSEVVPAFGPGPREAVDKFLCHNRDFALDQRCERFLVTLHPNGYLRRL